MFGSVDSNRRVRLPDTAWRIYGIELWQCLPMRSVCCLHCSGITVCRAPIVARDRTRTDQTHEPEYSIYSRTIEAMVNVVENLGKLERRVTISLPKDTVQKEVDSRIRQLAKNVRMPGFRPGKVPLKMVTQQYQGHDEAEVLSDKVGKGFFDVTRTENLRVAGQPSFAPKVAEGEVAQDYAFDATFEVYPEVKVGDVATAEIERTVTNISEAEIDSPLEILR